VREFKTGTLSNGALMRISPMIVYGRHLSDDNLAKLAMADCQITNYGNLPQLAVGAYVVALKQIVNREEEASKADTAKKAITAATKWLESMRDNEKNTKYKFALLDKPEGEVSAVDIVLKQWIECQRDTKNCWRKASEKPIFVLDIAMQRVFDYLRQVQSESADLPFFQVIENVVKEQGDTDTNAAIVGAAVGAMEGIHDIRGPNDTDYMGIMANVKNQALNVGHYQEYQPYNYERNGIMSSLLQRETPKREIFPPQGETPLDAEGTGVIPVARFAAHNLPNTESEHQGSPDLPSSGAHGLPTEDGMSTAALLSIIGGVILLLAIIVYFIVGRRKQSSEIRRGSEAKRKSEGHESTTTTGDRL